MTAQEPLSFRPIIAILGVIVTMLLLHYLPVMQQKWLAKSLIDEGLAKIYRGYPKVAIVRTSDRSNYTGLFNISGLALTGGNEEWWNLCVSVEAKAPDGHTEIAAFNAGGDRAKKELSLRRVVDFEQCRSDQAG